MRVWIHVMQFMSLSYIPSKKSGDTLNVHLLLCLSTGLFPGLSWRSLEFLPDALSIVNIKWLNIPNIVAAGHLQYRLFPDL